MKSLSDIAKSFDVPDEGAVPTSSSDLNWAQLYIANPVINSGAVELHNTVANAVNGISHTDVINKWELRPVGEAELASGAWFSQTVSGGLAGMVPYLVAGALVRKPLGLLGAGPLAAKSLLRAESIGTLALGSSMSERALGSTAKFMRGEHLPQIVGAGLYDGMRDTHNYETSTGNALGGVAAFSAFQLGNFATGELGLAKRLVGLAGTGVVGSAIQVSVSKGWSIGELPTREEYAHAGLAGMTMSLAAPAGQHLISRSVSGFNMALGRGEPSDRYLSNLSKPLPAEIALASRSTAFLLKSVGLKTSIGERSAFEGALTNSEHLRALNADAPGVRILETQDTTAYNPSKRLIQLGLNDRTPEVVGHELKHVDQVDSGRLEAGFKRAEQLLQAGDIVGAKAAYLETRVSSETEASNSEIKVAYQLSGSDLKPTAKMQSELRAEVAQKIGSAVELEFQQFVSSNGTFRPEQYFQKGRSGRDSDGAWQSSFDGWYELGQKDKIAVLKDIQRAPSEVRAKIIERSLLEPGEDLSLESWDRTAKSWAVRETASAKFKTLEPADRMNVWKRMLDSENYHVRLLGLSHIADLPGSSRTQAFIDAVKHTRALAIPERSNAKYSFRIGREEKDHRPNTPSAKNTAIDATLRKSPGQLIVESISSLPSSQRVEAWERALSFQQRRAHAVEIDGNNHLLKDSNLRLAALGNLQVLPASARGAIWQREFARANQSVLSTEVVDGLVKQISELPEEQRSAAVHTAFVSKAAISGASLQKALSSLPVEERLPAWEKLFIRSTSRWAVEQQRYEPDYFADALAAQRFQRDHRTTEAKQIDWSRTEKEIGIAPGARTRFVEDTVGIPRGLGLAIESLEPQDRLGAWQKLDSIPGKLYLSELARAVPSLPAEAQLKSIESLISKAGEPEKIESDSAPSIGSILSRYRKPEPPFKSDDLAAALGRLDHKLWTTIVDQISSLPSGKVRDQLLKGFPLEELTYRADHEASWEQLRESAINTYSQLFNAAFKNARPEDYPLLARWWNNTHLLEDEVPYTDTHTTDARRSIVENLDVVQLGRVLTSNLASHGEVDRFARENPSAMREIVKHYTGADRFSATSVASEKRIEAVLANWNRNRSLISATEELLQPMAIERDAYKEVMHPDYVMFKTIYGELSQMSTAAQRAKSFEMLRDDLFKASPEDRDRMIGSGENMVFNFPISMALKIGAHDPEQLRTKFFEPLERKLNDTRADYNWKLGVAREVASLQRDKLVDQSAVKLPDLRMPKVKGLSDVERQSLQAEWTNALFDRRATVNLWGDGTLGRLMPEHFGKYATDGGIVGRPQHEGHEFALDEHTLTVMDRIREHPLFETLPKKQQEDVLSAGMLHDIAKSPKVTDSNHDWVGTNVAWGVLGTMDYSPVRIQRIVNLMSRHTDASFDPVELVSDKLKNPDALNDLATFYRHPHSLTQLRILNEADIKSVHGDSRLWTEDVEGELNKVHRVTKVQVKSLNANLVPILTSELPSRFSLVQVTGPYAYLAHNTRHIEDSFLNQLNTVQSREYSVSSSLVTHEHQQFYSGEPKIFALVAGPWEQISQAYRDNLNTGNSVDWKGHVELSKKWLESKKAIEFATEINKLARRFNLPEGTGAFPHLAGARRGVAKFDSWDEMKRNLDERDPHVLLQSAIHKALTTDGKGKPLEWHNEIKLNNPTVVGLGVLRGGKPVYIEGIDGHDLAGLVGTGERPAWLLSGKIDKASLPEGTVSISESVWRALKERDLPITVLDP